MIEDEEVETTLTFLLNCWKDRKINTGSWLWIRKQTELRGYCHVFMWGLYLNCILSTYLILKTIRGGVRLRMLLIEFVFSGAWHYCDGGDLGAMVYVGYHQILYLPPTQYTSQPGGQDTEHKNNSDKCDNVDLNIKKCIFWFLSKALYLNF